jgi:hypothetical protein
VIASSYDRMKPRASMPSNCTRHLMELCDPAGALALMVLSCLTQVLLVARDEVS